MDGYDTSGAWFELRPEAVGPVLCELRQQGFAGVSIGGGVVLARKLSRGEAIYARHPSEDGFDYQPPVKRYGRGRPPSYPWAHWMDGKWHTATAGVDFTCTVAGFTAGLRKRASAFEMRLGFTVVPGVPESIFDPHHDVVAFRFLERNERLWDRPYGEDLKGELRSVVPSSN